MCPQEEMGLTCTCVHPESMAKARENALPDEVIYDVADFYKVFGDSTRIKILYTLLTCELCVGDLVEVLGMTQSAVSHQMRVLRQNGLVKFRKEGKTVYYSLDDDHVSTVLQQGLTHVMHQNAGEGLA